MFRPRQRAYWHWKWRFPIYLPKRTQNKNRRSSVVSLLICPRGSRAFLDWLCGRGFVISLTRCIWVSLCCYFALWSVMLRRDKSWTQENCSRTQENKRISLLISGYVMALCCTFSVTNQRLLKINIYIYIYITWSEGIGGLLKGNMLIHVSCSILPGLDNRWTKSKFLRTHQHSVAHKHKN